MSRSGKTEGVKALSITPSTTSWSPSLGEGGFEFVQTSIHASPGEGRLASEPRFASQIGGVTRMRDGCGKRKVRRLFYALSRGEGGGEAVGCGMRKDWLSIRV